MLFMYDIDGAIIGMMYKSTADGVYNTYYYVKNAQGDIVGITDKLGVLKYTYEYDSWGKLLNIVNASTGAVLAPTTENYATLNPFRYRGYYYDNETGLYYLNSRYYDPITRRFVNADDVVSANNDIPSSNVYQYCSNNPIIYADYSGESFAFAVAIEVEVEFIPTGAATTGTGVFKPTIFPKNLSLPKVGISDLTLPYPYIDIGLTTFPLPNEISFPNFQFQKNPDQFARPGQKKQGREKKEKKRTKDNWKGNKNKRQEPLKHHTPKKEHQKYPQNNQIVLKNIRRLY